MRPGTWIGIVVATAIAAGAVYLFAGGGVVAPDRDDEVEVAGADPAGAAPAASLGAGAPARPGAAAPAPTGRGTIFGTVRRDGRPVAAKVRVVFVAAREQSGEVPSSLQPPEWATSAARTATAGADGTYVVAGVPMGTAWVLATTEDGAAGFASATRGLEGVRVQIDVEAKPRGESLRGRVVHADGRPWKGRIGVQQQPIDEMRAMEGASPLATDEDGRFVVTGLAAGPVSVGALEPDAFLVVGPVVQVPHAGEYVLTLDAGGFDVRGRVVRADDGAGVVGARVVAYGTGEGRSAVVGATAGEDGRFALRAFGSRVSLRADAPGHAEGELHDVPHTGKEVELRVRRTVRLSGRVATPDGKPASGAVLVAEYVEPEEPWSHDVVTRARSDAEGRYAFETLVPGDVHVFARGGGWVSIELSGAAAPGAAPPLVKLVAGKDAVADLVVAKGPRIVGTVFDASGAPVAGAHVDTNPHEGNRMAVLFGAASGGAASHADEVDQTVTGADGTFVVDGVLPGVSYELTATAPGSPAGKSPAVSVGQGDVRVDLRLPAARWVDVTVLDVATGAPIAGASVSLVVRAASSAVVVSNGFEIPDFDSASTRFGPEATTDAAGRCRAGPVGPGRLLVTVRAEGHVTPEDGQPVEGSDARDDGLAATLRLARGYSIAGRVEMPDGTPAVEAEVHAAREGSRRGRWSVGSTTDRIGAFRFGNLPKQRFELTASVSGEREYAATATVEAGATDVVLRLAEKVVGTRIVVRVVDAAGAPVPSAQAEFQWGNGRGTSSTGEHVKDGRVVLRREIDDSTVVEVVVSDAVTGDGTRLPLGRTRLTGLRAGGEYELRMAPEMTIEGRVVGPDGKGVAGADVSAATGVDAGDHDAFFEFRSLGDTSAARTDAEGAFRVGALGGGEHSLRVTPPSQFVKPSAMRVQAGARGVTVTLRGGAAPTVTVVDAQGVPVAGVRVTATKEAKEGKQDFFGGYLSAMAAVSTGVEGRVRLSNLDPAETYVLRATPNATRGDLAGARLRRWTPGDVVVRLEKGHAITGFVRDPAGSPVEGAQVTCVAKAEDGETYRMEVGPDGAFRFGGLRAGAVELKAAIESGRDGAPAATANVTAPAEGVVLTIDRGLTLLVRIEGWEKFDEDYAQVSLWDEQEYLSAELVGAGGVVKFGGLAAGSTYSISTEPDPEGRMVFAEGLRAGGAEVVVPLQVGKTITGHVVAPKGAVGFVLIRERGLARHVRMTGDGAFKLIGVPEGTWKVRAKLEVGDVAYRGEADAAAGSTVEIETKTGK